MEAIIPLFSQFDQALSSVADPDPRVEACAGRIRLLIAEEDLNPEWICICTGRLLRSVRQWTREVRLCQAAERLELRARIEHFLHHPEQGRLQQVRFGLVDDTQGLLLKSKALPRFVEEKQLVGFPQEVVLSADRCEAIRIVRLSYQRGRFGIWVGDLSRKEKEELAFWIGRRIFSASPRAMVEPDLSLAEPWYRRACSWFFCVEGREDEVSFQELHRLYVIREVTPQTKIKLLELEDSFQPLELHYCAELGFKFHALLQVHWQLHRPRMRLWDGPVAVQSAPCMGAPLSRDRLFLERVRKQLCVESIYTMEMLARNRLHLLDDASLTIMPVGCEGDTRTFCYADEWSVGLDQLLSDYLGGRIDRDTEVCVDAGQAEPLGANPGLMAILEGELMVKFLDLRRSHALVSPFFWLLGDMPYPRAVIDRLIEETDDLFLLAYTRVMDRPKSPTRLEALIAQRVPVALQLVRKDWQARLISDSADGGALEALAAEVLAVLAPSYGLARAGCTGPGLKG